MSKVFASTYRGSKVSAIFKMLSNSISKDNITKTRSALFRNLTGIEYDNKTVADTICTKIFKCAGIYDLNSSELKTFHDSANNIEFILRNKGNKKPTEVVAELILKIKEINKKVGQKYTPLARELDMALASVLAQEMAKNPQNSEQLIKDAVEMTKSSLSKTSKAGIPYHSKNKIGFDYHPDIYKLASLFEIYQKEIPVAEFNISRLLPKTYIDKFRHNLIAIFNSDHFKNEAFEIVEMSRKIKFTLLGPSAYITRKGLPKPMETLELFKRLEYAANNFSPSEYKHEVTLAKGQLRKIIRSNKKKEYINNSFLARAVYSNPNLLPLIIKSIESTSNHSDENFHFANAVHSQEFNSNVVSVGPSATFLLESRDGKIKEQLLNFFGQQPRSLSIKKWDQKHPGIPYEAIVIDGIAYVQDKNKQYIEHDKRLKQKGPRIF